MNVGTKGKSPKQGLASAKDLPIELPEGRSKIESLTCTVEKQRYYPYNILCLQILYETVY